MAEGTLIRMVLWEASIWPFVAVVVAVGITTAIQFAERAYRYKRLREQMHAGTYGFHPYGQEVKEEAK